MREPSGKTERFDEVTPYEELKVAPTATVAEIRRAYLRAAREAHPDRLVDAGPGERDAAEVRMRRINAAWAILSDPAQRAQLDRRGGVHAARVRPVHDDGVVEGDEPIDPRLLDEVGAPLPRRARWATTAAPLLFVVSLSVLGFGLLLVVPVVAAVGLVGLAVSVVIFLAAPLLAMTGGRDPERGGG